MAAMDGNHGVLAFQGAVVIFDGKGVHRHNLAEVV
jgi:hypothetical protein